MLQYNNLSNEDLLLHYRDLDYKAFDAFFRRTSPIIYRFLLSRLRHPADADEALQETYFRVHRYILLYDPNQSAMAWLFSIARNAAFDVFARGRKHRNRSAPLLEENLPSSSTADAAVHARNELEVLLGTLSEEDQKLVVDRFLNERSYEEIALEQGISGTGARQRLSRLLRGLKKKSSPTS